jgi:hypothetical protein
MPVRTSTYYLKNSRTALYLHVPPYTVACTAMYNLVPLCTTLYRAGTRQYIPAHTGMYCHRNYLYRYVLVCTILRFLVVLYRLAYVLAHTSTYHLVLPYTRGTGFQMRISQYILSISQHIRLAKSISQYMSRYMIISVTQYMSVYLSMKFSDKALLVCPGYMPVYTFTADLLS